MNVITCQVSNSVSNIVGNVTGLSKVYFESLFPEGFFNKVYTVGSLSSNELVELQEDHIQQTKPPILSVSTNYIPGSNDTSMGILPIWRRGHRDIFKYSMSKFDYGYHPVFANDEDKIFIYTIPMRAKFIVNYKILCKSHMHKIDMLHHLRSRLERDEKYFLNQVRLESEIPKSIIKAIANIKGFDLENNDDVLNFLSYLQRFSEGYASREINLSTGNEMFSFSYLANILLSVENEAMGDGENREIKGMIQGDNTIDISLGYELWIPGSYVFESKELVKDDYDVFNDDIVSVNYTIQTRPPKSRDHRQQIGWSKFVTSDNKLIDHINFEPLLKDNHIEYIRYLQDIMDYELLDRIFEIMCFKDNKELENGKDFSIDWRSEDLEIQLNNLLLNTTYTMGIYADMKLLNEGMLILEESMKK